VCNDRKVLFEGAQILETASSAADRLEKALAALDKHAGA
jgi:hypothetical protein